MSDGLQSFGEHFVRQVGRTITKADFEKISPFAIAKMSDKELALWQSEQAIWPSGIGWCHGLFALVRAPAWHV